MQTEDQHFEKIKRKVFVKHFAQGAASIVSCRREKLEEFFTMYVFRDDDGIPKLIHPYISISGDGHARFYYDDKFLYEGGVSISTFYKHVLAGSPPDQHSFRVYLPRQSDEKYKIRLTANKCEFYLTNIKQFRKPLYPI